MGVKMGNILHRVGIESTSLAFQAGMLITAPSSLPDVTILPTPPCLRGSLHEGSVKTTTLIPVDECSKSCNAYNYTQALTSYSG